jgi:23S rRNA G2069 N7-methylase RlmK/C1962 C5-methylase RlmI
VRRRVATAWSTRQALGLPSPETDCFRLINGEGDRLSGLAADCFGSVCVVASSALWCERHREAIVGALEAELEGAGIRVVWRRSEARLKQDGWEGEEAQETESGGPVAAVPIDVKAAAQEEGAFVWGREGGLRYKIFPELGQKTGFYCDQRENRALLGSLATGKRVLDLFCYTGGYALAAGRGGATEVVGVDSSALAVDTAAENARANGLEGRVAFVRSDVLDFVRGLAEARPETEAGSESESESRSRSGGPSGLVIPDARLFDIVVADPPKLAPSRRDLPRALHKYAKINRAAMAALRPGGLLLTHTCSAALTQAPGAFQDMVRKSANDLGRSLTVLRVSHAAPCHVLNPSYPENEYLTAMLCVVV